MGQAHARLTDSIRIINYAIFRLEDKLRVVQVALAECLDGNFLLLQFYYLTSTHECIGRIIVLDDANMPIVFGINDGKCTVAYMTVGTDGKGLQDDFGCSLDIHI